MGKGATAGVVGTTSGCCDTCGGSFARVRFSGSSSGVVDVVVGPIGGNRGNGFVDCGPGF